MADWCQRFQWMQTLQQGWDGYDAEPPSLLALQNAESFLTEATAIGLTPNRVNPSVVGGVGITFRYGPWYAYVEFRNTGSCCIAQVTKSQSEFEIQTVKMDSIPVTAAMAKAWVARPDVVSTWVGRYSVCFPNGVVRTLEAPHGHGLTSDQEDDAAFSIACWLWGSGDVHQPVPESRWYDV